MRSPLRPVDSVVPLGVEAPGDADRSADPATADAEAWGDAANEALGAVMVTT